MSSRLDFLIIFVGQQVLSADSKLKFLGRGIRAAGKLKFNCMVSRNLINLHAYLLPRVLGDVHLSHSDLWLVLANCFRCYPGCARSLSLCTFLSQRCGYLVDALIACVDMSRERCLSRLLWKRRMSISGHMSSDLYRMVVALNELGGITFSDCGLISKSMNMTCHVSPQE